MAISPKQAYNRKTGTTWTSPGRTDLPGAAGTTATVAGALTVGTAAYDLPTGAAMYVSPSGNNANSGSVSSPKLTLGAAIDAVASGGTVVVRAGVYPEKVGTKTKACTIQNYPGEAVWFDGADVVTGFTGSGPWVKTGWTTEFDHSTSYTAGDTGTRLIEPAYPNAAWPDMLFIDGVRQELVVGVTPGAGQWTVDYAANTLTIGSNPAGHTVHAATRDLFANLQAPGTVVRGIGIRRYATSLSGAAATLIFSGGASGITIENCRFEDCGQQSLSVRADNCVVRSCDIVRAGCMGLHTDALNNLLVERCFISEANYKHFKHQPISSGMKFSPSANNVTVRGNYIVNSDCAGIWFDTDCLDDFVDNNYVANVADVGILNEANMRMVITNNYVYNSTGGINSVLSDSTEIWNNRTDGNRLWDIACTQDARRPWLSKNVRIANNVFGGSVTPTGKLFQAYVLDKESNVPAVQMVSLLAGNLFSALSGDGVSSTRMFGWDLNGDNLVSGAEIIKTTAAFKTTTGWDNSSTAAQNPSTTQIAAFDANAQTLPTVVTTKLGIAAGTKKMGPMKPQPITTSSP